MARKTYKIRIVGPAGRVTYLRGGKEVNYPDVGTSYRYSDAMKAGAKYREKMGKQLVIIDVVEWDPDIY